MDATTIYQVVKKHYSSAARTTSASYANSVARAFGYTDEELAVIPEGANLGMSCGNPIALGSISTGETVIDLGSGAGFDAFLAAPMVGPSGKVIGVDMNEDMLAKARENKNKTGASNVDFIKSKITEIALPDAIADCVISNCVINLVPETEKYRVFNEIARLLKPGGRVAISDILARKAFPETYKKDIALLCGCISGASLKRDYERYLAQAGFTDVYIVDTGKSLNVYNNTTGTNDCCGGSTESTMADSCCAEGIGTGTAIRTLDLNEWAGSFNILAVKSIT